MSEQTAGIGAEGALQRFPPQIRDYYGSGWVSPGLTPIIFLENLPKIALNQYWYFGVVFCLHALLKVIGYYDFSVLSISVMGYPKSLDGGWVGGVSSYQWFLDFWIFF